LVSKMLRVVEKPKNIAKIPEKKIFVDPPN
jgi:hypothetical protein